MGPKSIIVDVVNYEDCSHCQLISVVPQILQGTQIIEWNTKKYNSVGFVFFIVHITTWKYIFLSFLCFWPFLLEYKFSEDKNTWFSSVWWALSKVPGPYGWSINIGKKSLFRSLFLLKWLATTEIKCVEKIQSSLNSVVQESKFTLVLLPIFLFFDTEQLL